MIRNRYEVPPQMWRKWSPSAQVIFNRVYKQFGNQKILIHPETHPLHETEWHTIRFNAAFIAACAVDGYRIVETSR